MIKAIIFDFDHVVGLKPETTGEQDKWYNEYMKAELMRKEQRISMDTCFKKLKFTKKEIQKSLEGRTAQRAPNKLAFDLAEKAGLYGIKSFIGTNAPPVAMDLWFKTYPKLRKYFDGVFCPEDFDQSRKPEPEFYLGALKKIKVWPHQAIFYDDKIANVMGASRIGIRGFVYSGGEFRTK